ncbi:hypothetical protein RB594_001629 [Gaeumannomyces avenae]
MTSTKWPNADARHSGSGLHNYLPHHPADVVVPPRSYYCQDSKPLAGCRIAVKDMFDLQGFPTTLCNLAWAESWGSTKKTTAPSIQRLQDLGAIIVGKTRLNAMVIREETMECVEFLAPFNPRGDGYQTSSDSDKLEKKPLEVTRILYPTDYLPTKNAAQTAVIDQFIRDLEESTGVNKTEINLVEEWRKTKETTSEDDLPEHLSRAGTMPYYKDAIKIVKSWFDDYTEAHGKTPFIHRALRWRWEEADKLSDKERDQVLPVEDSKPSYRDDPPPPFGLLSGFSPLYMSPIAGAPEITAPVGEVPYQSLITRREEHLPVSISLVSAPGKHMSSWRDDSH